MLNLKQMKWFMPKEGYTFDLMFMHGDADAFTIHSLHFLDEIKAQQFLDCLVHLDVAIIKFIEGSTEDVVELLAKKTGHDYKELYSWFEPLIQTDATQDVLMASFVAYRILYTDSIKSYYADFNGKPYCNVGIHEGYLNDWK